MTTEKSSGKLAKLQKSTTLRKNEWHWVDNPPDPEGIHSILPRMAASRTRWWKGTGDLGRMPPRMGVRPEGTRPGRLRYGAAANGW
jgi:hypothetical protein